ncbi:hypothetical protein BDY17DRAFT_151968 [Neohortaea acidophila]|uniref:Concanavalin A-like lectin/glucanase domain-containing protein n=1 Tax=Neohortaea acidophila TaxID=245834 RepID=A0A6A6PU82_9PEZI|nr:uncharacterized protein BDY17DRAFT_151968 [Neohortaea acidophila]KAF2483668.1 hypothetical protein BDY17DRAFT_151968 [Neohortaea acidophila]
MKRLTLALALFCTARPSLAAFCNYFSTGPVANGTFIRTANATLVIPPHSPKTGLLSLWTGMGTSNGDLIQALVESYNGSADTGCGVLPKQDWCAYSSTLSVNGKKQGQIGARQVLVKPGDHVQQSYIYNDADGLYDQYTLVNGRLTSTLRTRSGHAQGWGTAEECQPEEPCGPVPAHHWIDVVLVFDSADPSYGATVGTNGASGNLVTKDGGVVWTAAEIHINACDFNFTAS